MKLLLLITLLVATACGKEQTPVFQYGRLVPAELETYVASFEKHYGKSLENIRFDFVSLAKPTVGRCWMDEHLVEFDKDYWDNANETTRELLVYHELGHCELRREHTDAKHTDYRPVSIMHPILLWYVEYLAHKQEYIDELFSR
jgi:predicted SprT family Zn-dependent metalloprotease